MSAPIEFEDYVPTPQCGAPRGPQSIVFCELPVDHADRWHFGRSTGNSNSGRWFSWPVTGGESLTDE